MLNTVNTLWLGLSVLMFSVTAAMASPATMLSPPVVEERIAVRTGESAVVGRRTQRITNKKANLGSVAKIVQGSGPTATNVVLYRPPAGAPEKTWGPYALAAGAIVDIELSA